MRIVYVLILAMTTAMASGCDEEPTPANQNPAANSTPGAAMQWEHDPDQKVTTLTEKDEQRLDAQRAVIEQFIDDDPVNLSKYQTAAGKLGTIRAILEAGVFSDDQTYELQCLGIVLGDAFVLDMGMEWVMVEDKYGRDPALRLPGTSILTFPLTMISKRIERGESVDVFDLYNGVAANMEKMKEAGALRSTPRP